MTVWEAIDKYYIENSVPHRYSTIKETMFINGPAGYPKLKGTAAEIRHLGEVLFDIWLASMDPNDELHVLVKLALEASCTMERIINKHYDEYKIPDPDAQALLDASLQYCQAQSRLSNFNGLQIMNITMKLHYIVHACSRAKYLHPRFGWCFRGEDFMGTIRTVAAACLHGTPKQLVSKKIGKRMCRAMHFQMTGLRR